MVKEVNTKKYNNMLYTRMGCTISAILSDFDFITVNDISDEDNKYKIKAILVGKHNLFDIQPRDQLDIKLKLNRTDIGLIIDRCKSPVNDLVNTTTLEYIQNNMMIKGEAWYFNNHLLIIHRSKYTDSSKVLPKEESNKSSIESWLKKIH
tara:strand:- start:724 stop:1173 length:450 start_codon:yes stop_codon:yes gene_type:complete